MAVRVAIIGASGIGRHHAKWWMIEGANVCAFAGTSIHSVEKTRRALDEELGFEGRGYMDINAMLVREVPDVVDVCSPPDCHARHVRMALEAGCSVLCEKPFVWDETWPHEDLLAEAWELVDLAEAYGRQLAVCTQYAAGARMIADIWRRFRKNEPITRYLGRIETPAKGRAPDPQRIWLDLAPHLFSALQYLVPDAQMQWDTVKTRFKGYEGHATFDVVTDDGRDISCCLHAHNRTAPPDHVRHFALNRFPFVMLNDTGEDGHYCARIESPAGTFQEPDMMRLLIRDFLNGTPLLTGEALLRNLEWTLGMLSLAQKR